MTEKHPKGTKIEINDFISTDTNVPESKVFKDDKLLAFSNIKVGVIDPRISNEILELTKKIKEKAKEIDDLN